MIVDFNGICLDANEIRISPFDAGYQFGDGLFDTLRSYKGFLYQLEEHLQRLQREAEMLQLPFEDDTAPWRERIENLLLENDLIDVDARIRIQISRGGEADTDHVNIDPEGLQSVELIIARPVSSAVAKLQENGMRIMTVDSSFARGNFPQIKSLNYLPSIMALRFARSKNFDEACLLNTQQKVLEGATSNIFIYKDGRIKTPSARLGLLAGITRNKVLQLAKELELPCDEIPFELRDLLLADEVFLTGSVKEVIAAVQINDTVIGDGKTGPLTRRLQEAYKEDVILSRVTEEQS